VISIAKFWYCNRGGAMLKPVCALFCALMLCVPFAIAADASSLTCDTESTAHLTWAERFRIANRCAFPGPTT